MTVSTRFDAAVRRRSPATRRKGSRAPKLSHRRSGGAARRGMVVLVLVAVS
jgi:hypothetical protein